MRSRHTRTAAAAAALVAAGLAVFALRPSSTKTATLAAANPPAEVRTVVIRRTIHIVKHRPLTGAAGSSAWGYGASGSNSYASSAAGAVRTHVSGSHTVAGAPTTYSATTRTSPGHSGTSYGSGSSSAPVTSRTTPHGGSTHSGSGSGGPATTRTSSHGGSGGGVRTRSSGGGETGDGGGD